MKEETRTLLVAHEIGLHCRPSASFVKLANQFESDITVEKDGSVVNGKSIMGMMMLAAGNGSKLNIKAMGRDAVQALNALESLEFLIPYLE
jgi:phosphocarrier protein HPr